MLGYPTVQLPHCGSLKKSVNAESVEKLTGSVLMLVTHQFDRS